MQLNIDESARMTQELVTATESVFSKKVVQILSEKKLPFAQVQRMAVLITDALPYIKYLSEYQGFLLEMQKRFPILEDEIRMLNQFLNVEQEKKVINRLEGYFKHLTTK
jgi:hypothetical protein